MTFIIILIIVYVVVATYINNKRSQVLYKSLEDLKNAHEKAFKRYRNLTIGSFIIIVAGIIIYNCFETHRIEVYEYWLFGTRTGTKEVLTKYGWWSYILIGTGSLIGIPSIIGLLDRLKAIIRYKDMTADEYNAYKCKIIDDIHREENIMKNVKRVNTAIKIFNKLNGL